MFGSKKSSVKIGLHHAIPEFHRHFANPRPARNTPGKMGHDGSVIDVHVDLPVSVDDLIDHPFYAIFAANVDS